MEEYGNSRTVKSGTMPIAVDNTSWLSSVDNELQALIGFGACVAQGAMGIAQIFAQSEVSVAKIDADAKTTSSRMPLIHEEIKRLGARIDKFSLILLDKYAAPNLTSEQKREKEKLEEMIKKDQQQLDKLLQYAMTPCQMQ